ncbi:hemolysin family protein [Alterinioella nitratireducens]|jgi:magnesium and cobalt transporter|uniref:hemolysin family protein n=1 Tax=Alterinioella nitratireducens TaxID=2735915 RepID=UPI0015568969|nr:hemolysin family protein [Alterinioella nitratireducens]NPD20413.1 HlyC/CorC family transporter [Alterinioella nitratireducens]
MSSNPDSSSSAAQSAPPEDESADQRPGLFARIFGSASPDDTPEPEANPSEPHHPVGNGALAAIRMHNLRRLRMDDVSIPRAEITGVANDISMPDLVEVFRQTGYTRLPVYDGTLDTPVGLIHLKDLALGHGFNGKSNDFDVTTMLRPLLYAPPSMPIGVMLQKMQSERIHMALVIDEYGGVDGLVTLEDLIEQIIGEIEDEHDVDEDQLWTDEGGDSWLVLARAPLDEFEEAIGMTLTEDLDDEEIDTLGGLVFVLTGRVPARGEVIPHPSGAEIEVIDADPRRIKRLRVRLPKLGA